MYKIKKEYLKDLTNYGFEDEYIHYTKSIEGLNKKHRWRAYNLIVNSITRELYVISVWYIAGGVRCEERPKTYNTDKYIRSLIKDISDSMIEK